MKKYILSLFLLSCVLTSFAQDAFIKYTNIPIKLYKGPIGIDVDFIFVQDTINETNYYDVLFIESSPLRFKVKLHEEGSILDPIEGWIDKDCVAVWPRHKNEKEIYLYVEPCIQSAKIKLHDTPQVYTVIDYNGDWRKVICNINGKIYIGWTREYCPNTYNSCT